MFISKHNEELELLRAQIALEMEQEKDTAHNNCQSVGKNSFYFFPKRLLNIILFGL